ncbi:MAG: response regulator [Marinilabiliales bacterium]|nr:MAG: response regulator [Marinilabiliales bacterium]
MNIGPSWNEKKILVVEDEPMTYRLIEVMLSKTGVQLYKASDGLEALKIIQNYSDIDLILMDIGLPNMNGYEATRKIKKSNSKIPIIAQTAYVMKDHKQLCFESGCDDYISKPYSSDDLKNVISKYF